MKKLSIPAASVKGFNYHPGYSSSSYDDWMLFDEEVWRKELSHGKKCFPSFNTVRIWLSWNAYCRMGEQFIASLKKVIDICRELSIYVIPSVFNRWHDPVIDCDGIYIDHFLPNSSWLHKNGDPFEKYLDDLAKNFKDEKQILVWDVCNEPLAYNAHDETFPCHEIILQYVLSWLHIMADRLRADGVTQPLGIGSTGRQPMEIFGDACDVYLTHLYYKTDLESFEQRVRSFVDEAKQNGKELIVSECCWGSFDDRRRGELIRGTLSTLTKYGVGFIAHALWSCGCTDLHDPDDGPLSPDIGNLAFICPDGSIRPYHEIFNEF